MSFDSSLFSLLTGDSGVSALVNARVYPQYAPDGSAMPCITYTVIACRPLYSADGIGDIADYTLQIQCWADTHDAVIALTAAVRALLDNYKTSPFGVVMLTNATANLILAPANEEQSEFGYTLEYSIWFSE